MVKEGGCPAKKPSASSAALSRRGALVGCKKGSQAQPPLATRLPWFAAGESEVQPYKATVGKLSSGPGSLAHPATACSYTPSSHLPPSNGYRLQLPETLIASSSRNLHGPICAFNHHCPGLPSLVIPNASLCRQFPKRHVPGGGKAVRDVLVSRLGLQPAPRP